MNKIKNFLTSLFTKSERLLTIIEYDSKSKKINTKLVIHNNMEDISSINIVAIVEGELCEDVTGCDFCNILKNRIKYIFSKNRVA